jgi:hypothetical protein
MLGKRLKQMHAELNTIVPPSKSEAILLLILDYKNAQKMNSTRKGIGKRDKECYDHALAVLTNLYTQAHKIEAGR